MTESNESILYEEEPVFNYDHYISGNIKTLYRKRLFAPILYLFFILLLFLNLPISSVVFPASLENPTDIKHQYQTDNPYVTTTLSNLKFTGYIRKRFGRTNGYYYSYFKENNDMILVLLSPSSCEEGLPIIPQISVNAKISKLDDSCETVLTKLSEDLSWNEKGITGKVNRYYFSEPDNCFTLGRLLFLCIIVTTAFAIIRIISYILYINKPYFAPCVRILSSFGKPKELLATAEEELSTLPQLATEDMFITEHFFIETSPYGTALIPIQEILWIYKHSTLHKIFWYHFSISYTLSIIANKHLSITCPKNLKSDIDGIIDYLSEANHDILVGFSEENRKKVQAMQRNQVLRKKNKTDGQ